MKYMSDVNSIAPPELGPRGEEMVTWEMNRDPELSRDAAIGNVMQYVVGNAQGEHGQVPDGFHEAFPKEEQKSTSEPEQAD